MPCCCTNKHRVCDVIICDDADLVLPIPIPADGEYTLELDFLSDVIRKTAALSMGDNATFDYDGLNERFTYSGRVVGPDGQSLTFDIDGKTYDCIEFTTKRAIS